LKTATLLQDLRAATQREVQTASVCDGLCHRFDQASHGTRVQKTTRRQIVTLELARFEAVEVVRTEPHEAGRLDSPLADLVPKGGTYGYDLMAHVGCETLLRGRPLQAVARELPQPIPFSSLYDLQQKFLFYLGHLHREATPRLAAYLQQRGGSTWLIDGTIEGDTPMYFGVYDAQDNFLLGTWKIPTENADAIAPCLAEAADWFGRPQRVLHDLSHAMAEACRRLGDDVPHTVCHFHLLRDVGEELYAGPQAALRELVRRLKLQARLKDQRKHQTQWIRDHLEQPRGLADLLRGSTTEATGESLGREVLLAFHQWILDYPHDGRRQGFPFDPYLLFFHRRVVRAAAAVERFLEETEMRSRTPRVLVTFAQMLRQYLQDPKVTAAAGQYEAAYQLFERLRTALRLSAQGDHPLHERYVLGESETQDVRQALESLQAECREQSRAAADEAMRDGYQVVLDHLERYADRLFAAEDSACRERTTNRLEGFWGASKRRCRQRHGRRQLTRDFQSLPAEYMLVGNLENPVYVELVLGELSALPRKLAEAGRTAGSWTRWRQAQQPLRVGRLPRRLVRAEDFLDTLVGVYQDQSGSDAACPVLA
jgi:hypothetical protein